jgi:hypothetical protein
LAKPSFFRADEPKSTSPAPTDWFGSGRRKFKARTPAISDESDTGNPEDPKEGYDGWRQFQLGINPREPLWNPLLPPDKKEEAIKFRNADKDRRAMVYVLEHVAEILEAAGHDDLAAECEQICEMAFTED